MKLIKLNAIDSTNSFLKELAKNSVLENFTVVVANEQTKGRGQQENVWISQPHKNLTTSIFIKDLDIEILHHKYLNFAVSLAVYDLLYALEINGLSIKWPNDIMAGNNKICGILIENNIKKNRINSTIIGIGLNVNQVNFSNTLTKVTSIKKITNRQFNLEILLKNLVENIKLQIQSLSNKEFKILEDAYLNVLYKKNVPTMFKDKTGNLFMGKINGISKYGNLLVELENEQLKEFVLKEISIA